MQQTASLLLFGADKAEVVHQVLGALRLKNCKTTRIDR